MSDYQDIEVIAVAGPTIALEIREVHVDMAAVHALVGGSRKPVWTPPPARRTEAAIFASFLLRDYGTPFARNAFCTALRGRSEWPPPTELVVDVTISERTRIGTSTNRTPLYSARVTITVADPALLADFKRGKGYSATAFGGNPWERSHFLG